MNERLQDRRVWLFGSAIVALLLIAGSWLILIKPSLADADSIREQAAEANDLSARSSTVNSRLSQKLSSVPSMQKKLAALLDAVPATSALPEFTREITARATALHVSLQNLSVTAPAPVTSTDAAAAPSASPQDGSSPSQEPTASAAPQSPAPATAQQYQIGITFTASAPKAPLVAFVGSMQHGRRDLLVTSTTLNGAAGKSTLNVQAFVFTAPMTAAQLAQTRQLFKPAK